MNNSWMTAKQTKYTAYAALYILIVIGILGLAVFGISLTRLANGNTVYFTTYRAVAVYVPISAALGIGIALVMFLRWRKGRRGTNVP